MSVPMTKETLRELAERLDTADIVVRAAIAVELREWADDLEHAENGDEKCEGCDLWLAETEGTSDNEGVRLCDSCAESLQREADATSTPPT